MLVRETMTPKPYTITLAETLHGAMELMAMKRIRHLPVVDAQGVLIGLVTDRDLRRAAPSPLFPGGTNQREAMEQTTIERVMVRSPTTINVDQNMKDAAALFVDKKYGALPVLQNGRLVGIVTPIDLMRAWLKTQP